MRGGLGRDNVGSRSAADDSDIHRQAFLKIGEARNSFDLTRQFYNRVNAFLEIESRVGGLARNFD